MFLFNYEYNLEIASCIFQSLFGYLCIAFEFSISLHFASFTFSLAEISGIGLATTIVNLIVLAVGHGFNQSLNINVAQAVGSSNHELALKYLNITCYTHLITNAILAVIIYYSIDICALFINTSSTLVIQSAKEYSIYTMIAASLFNIYEAQKLYMIAHKILTPFKYIHFTTTLSHIFWCYLLLIFFNQKIFGLGMCIIISQTLNQLLLRVYILLYEQELFKGFSFQFMIFQQFSFYFDYFTNSLTYLVHILADYGIFIVLNLMSYLLGDVAVNAQLALGNTSGIYFKLPICTSIAIQTFLGHELGKSNIAKAKQYASIALLQFTIIVAIILILNWVFRYEWAAFYTKDEEVINQLMNVLPYFILGCLLLDGYQGCLTGILKGAEKADIVSISTLIIYYVIGVPMIFVLVLYFNMGLIGIWLGFGTANLTLLTYYVFSIVKMDWDQQKNKILEKLQVSKNLIKL